MSYLAALENLEQQRAREKKRLKQLEREVDHLSRYKELLSSAHGALADCGLPVPGLDQDIAPVIRKLTDERDSLKRKLEAMMLYSQEGVTE